MSAPETTPLTPAERDRRVAAGAATSERLREQGVVAVAVTWVDHAGITRTKAVPLDRFARAAGWGIGVSPVFDTSLADDSFVTGRHAGGPVGDLRMHPDPHRVVVLDQQPGWAWSPGDRYAQDGTAHPQDQRLFARRRVDALAAAGLTALAAFEVEWSLSSSSDVFTPAVAGNAYGFTRLIEQSDHMRDVLVALDRQGVAVEQFHPEYAAGQYELSVAPQDPVAAADTLVLVRETVRAAALRHGLRASFSPKTLAAGAGNGGHLHLSVWREEQNLFGGGDGPLGLTAEAVSFTAGILHRLPALLALGAPSPASYLRLVPQHWAGAYQAWGLENREAALRLVQGSPGTEGRAANLEVKAFDLAANPYLLVGAVLAAGQAGLSEQAELPAPVDVDPATLSAAERESRGIGALPGSLSAATDAFEADAALVAAFGEGFAATVADVRRGEIAAADGLDDDAVVAAYLWCY